MEALQKGAVNKPLGTRGPPNEHRQEKAVGALQSYYQRWGKRCMDLILASGALILVSPILAVCVIAVRLGSGRPMLFTQPRIGRGGKAFLLLKLRSMKAGSQPGPKVTSAGDVRVTRVGRWLRRTKLDELPQLVNVIRGDMSLVGPRPEVPEYVALYSEQQRQVLRCRPGITSPAALDYIDEEAILARAESPEQFYREFVMPRKLEIDLRYCRSISIQSDLTLLLRTARRIWTRRHPAA